MEALTCSYLGNGDWGEGAGQVFHREGLSTWPQGDGTGMCGHTQDDVRVVCVGTASAGRWLLQPTGELQNSDPTTHSKRAPSKEQKDAPQQGWQWGTARHGPSWGSHSGVQCPELVSAHLLIKNSNPTLN